MEDNIVIFAWKLFNSDNFSNVSETRKAEFTLVEKPHLKVISFNKEKVLWIGYVATSQMEGHLKLGLQFL